MSAESNLLGTIAPVNPATRRRRASSPILINPEIVLQALLAGLAEREARA